jgi:hypothetical protein
MHRGYIKIWRKISDAGWLKNHKLCAFWLWCLIKASHKEHDIIVGCQQIHLMPGDLIFGLNKASEELEMSVRSIRTILDFLKNSQNLTIKTTNKFSVISIVNWSTYQGEDIQNDNQNDKQPTNNRQATDNKQECKELKNEKKTYTDDFLSFWNEYPKKVGKDAAWKAWKARNGTIPKISVILAAISTQRASPQWIKNGGQYVPNPATWINGGRWNDEITGTGGNESTDREGVIL